MLVSENPPAGLYTGTLQVALTRTRRTRIVEQTSRYAISLILGIAVPTRPLSYAAGSRWERKAATAMLEKGPPAKAEGR